MTASAPALTGDRATANFIGYSTALSSIGLVVGVLGPTLPGLAAQTHSTLSGISVLFVAKSGGYLAGSLLAGRLYDRIPGHPIMAVAGGLMAASLALTPLTPWLWLLAAVTALLGMAEAWTDVGSNTLIVWTYRERVSPFMNGLHFAFGLGAFLAPLIVERAMAWGGGIAGAYWVLALLALPPALWLLRQPSPAGHRAAEAGRGEPVRYGLVALCVTCFFFYVGSEVSFGAWVFTYANVTGLADAASGAYLTSAFWGALTLGRLISIPLATRFRPRTLLVADLAGGLLSLSLAALWPGQAWALWVSAIGMGLSMASIFPTLMAFASRRIALSGQITSLFFIGGSLGGTALPWLIGQLFEPLGPGVVLAVILAGLVLDTAAFAALLVLAPRPASG
jgi:FHS family Na+ dependent glucose MFS transporter 1